MHLNGKKIYYSVPRLYFPKPKSVIFVENFWFLIVQGEQKIIWVIFYLRMSTNFYLR